MKTKYLFVLTLTLFVLGQVQQSFGQQATTNEDHWTFLGDRRADYTLDHDEMFIIEGNVHINALKFIIRQGALTMHKCTVYFSNGDTKDIVFLDEVNRASDGITMNIEESNRTIDKISFWYDTQDSSDKKSIVEVWAMNQSAVIN